MSQKLAICFCGHAIVLHTEEGCTYCPCGVDDYYVRGLEAILDTIRKHCMECLQTQRPVNTKGILALISGSLDPGRYDADKGGLD